MSIHVVSWVLRHSPAEGSARLVLIVLADRAHEDGTGAYPSIDTIGREARIRSRTTVKAALRSLQQAGQIVDDGVSEFDTRRWIVTMRPTEGGPDIDPRPEFGGNRPESDPEPSLEPSSKQRASYRRAVQGSGPNLDPPGPDARAAWGRSIDALREASSDTTFHIWLSELELAGVNGHAIAVAAPDHVYSLVRDRYLATVQQAATAGFGRELAVDLVRAGQAPPAGQLAGRADQGPAQGTLTLDSLEPEGTDA